MSTLLVMTPEQVERMAAMRESGLSYRQIGRRYKIASSTVQRYLKGENQWPDPADKEQALKLHKQGLDYLEIAKRLGRQPKTVRRWIDPDYREECNRKNRAGKAPVTEPKILGIHAKPCQCDDGGWPEEERLPVGGEWWELDKPSYAMETTCLKCGRGMK